jgi:hypothetical protein
VDIPVAARAHTPEGAEAFVKFYLDQVNVAWTLPRTGLLMPLSEDGCLSCKAFEKTAQDLVSKGHRYARSPATFEQFTAFDGAPPGKQYVRVLGTQHKVDIVDPRGKVVSTDPRKSMAVSALTVWKEDRWLLYDMG